MAEDHLPGASFGPLAIAGFRIQFERLRDGDRFWYERDPDFSAAELAELRGMSLANVILRNTGVLSLQSNVFFAVPEPSTWLMLSAAGLVAVLRRNRRFESAR